MKRTLFLISFIFTVIISAAQNKHQSDYMAERIFIHTDRQEYVAGEQVWFKIYCSVNDEFSNLSKLAYIEIIDPNGYSADRKMIRLNNGMGYGVLTIPDSSSSGMYQLTGYTNWLKNFGDSYFFKDTLLIFNPEKNLSTIYTGDKIPDDSTRTESSKKAGQSGTQSLSGKNKYPENHLIHAANLSNIEISGLNSNYTPDETINLELSSKRNDSVVNLSVSVHKFFHNSGTEPAAEAYLKPPPVMNALNDEQLLHISATSENSEKYYPEDKGMILRGQLLDGDQPLKNELIFLSFVDSVSKIKIRRTNDKGIFRFFIYPDAFKKDLVIIPEKTDKKLTIKIEDKYVNRYSFRSEFDPGSMNEAYLGYLKDLYLTYRVQEHYQVQFQETDSSIYKPDWTTYNFYERPEERIHFDDYILLDSLKEYFYELTPGVKIIKENKEPGIKIVNKKTKQFMNGSPALFIDGVMYPNARKFLTVKPKQCDRLDIVQRPVLLHDKIYYGIISLYTKSKNLPDIELTENAVRVEYDIHAPSSFYSPSIPEEKNWPDLRNTLYWNPDIRLVNEKNKKLSFSTGKSEGWYVLEIAGMTPEGTTFYRKKYFKVGDPNK